MISEIFVWLVWLLKQLWYLCNGKLSEKAWRATASLLKEIIPPFPNLPSPLFQWAMGLAVPFGGELVLVRNGKVLLIKRNFYGDEAYHTPGTYLATNETFLEAAQRCADRELKVKILSAKPISPPINHPHHPRFHDVTELFLCEFEGEPAEGEWFGVKNFPPMLKVQQEYPQYILPLLR